MIKWLIFRGYITVIILRYTTNGSGCRIFHEAPVKFSYMKVLPAFTRIQFHARIDPKNKAGEACGQGKYTYLTSRKSFVDYRIYSTNQTLL